jgi:hypothetical protein
MSRATEGSRAQCSLAGMTGAIARTTRLLPHVFERSQHADRILANGDGIFVAGGTTCADAFVTGLGPPALAVSLVAACHSVRPVIASSRRTTASVR